MGGIELPHSAQQPGRSDYKAAIHHDLTEYEGRGVSGDQHEQVGSIAEAVVPGGEPGERRVRDVTQKDQPVRQSAK